MIAIIASFIRWLIEWWLTARLLKTFYRKLSFLYGVAQLLIPRKQAPHIVGSSLSCIIVPSTTCVEYAAELLCRKALWRRLILTRLRLFLMFGMKPGSL